MIVSFISDWMSVRSEADILICVLAMAVGMQKQEQGLLLCLCDKAAADFPGPEQSCQGL